MQYDRYGVAIGHVTQAERDRITERVRQQDEAQEERERSSRAWARLCGMVAPIGGPARI